MNNLTIDDFKTAMIILSHEIESIKEDNKAQLKEDLKEYMSPEYH